MFISFQMFKPLNKRIRVIYTAHDSCGMNLNKGVYLLSGKIILLSLGRVWVETEHPDSWCWLEWVQSVGLQTLVV